MAGRVWLRECGATPVYSQEVERHAWHAAAHPPSLSGVPAAQVEGEPNLETLSETSLEVCVLNGCSQTDSAC